VSNEPVTRPAAAQLIAEANDPVIVFDGPGQPIRLDASAKRVSGSTLVRLGRYSLVTTPKERKALMVRRDTPFLVEQLAAWSTK